MSDSTPTLIYADPRMRGGELTAESRLMKEWLERRYPDATMTGRIRLGPTRRTAPGGNLTPAMEAMLSVENWYPDALVLSKDELLIVEAKVNPKPAAIGEVLFYHRLIARTPELAAHVQYHFQPMVLFGEDDPDVNAFARSLGVRVEIFIPPWLAGYLLRRSYRGRNGETAEPRSLDS
jgi:hypothetical protein